MFYYNKTTTTTTCKLLHNNTSGTASRVISIAAICNNDEATTSSQESNVERVTHRDDKPIIGNLNTIRSKIEALNYLENRDHTNFRDCYNNLPLDEYDKNILSDALKYKFLDWNSNPHPDLLLRRKRISLSYLESVTLPNDTILEKKEKDNRWSKKWVKSTVSNAVAIDDLKTKLFRDVETDKFLMSQHPIWKEAHHSMTTNTYPRWDLNHKLKTVQGVDDLKQEVYRRRARINKWLETGNSK